MNEMVLMRHIIGVGEFPREVRREHRMRETAVKRGRSLSGVWEMGVEQRDGRHPRNEPRHDQQTQGGDLATDWTHGRITGETPSGAREIPKRALPFLIDQRCM